MSSQSSASKPSHPSGGQPSKRSVSFRSSPSAATITEFSADQSPNGNSSPFPSPSDTSLTSSPLSRMSSSGLKPALKPSSRKLPPPEQYQHSDPLLRRLRLVDDKGNAIDLRKHFRDCKVVALYFSSQWAGAPLKEYQKVRNETLVVGAIGLGRWTLTIAPYSPLALVDCG